MSDFAAELDAARRDAIPQMALRPDAQFPDEMDDIVVRGVVTFRAEAMTEHDWWMACYFANGDRLVFDVYRARKPARTVVSVREYPPLWADIDRSGTVVGR